MDSSLNQRLAESLLRIVSECTPEAQPSEALLEAVRGSIAETTKSGNFERLEARVKSLESELHAEMLRFPRPR